MRLKHSLALCVNCVQILFEPSRYYSFYMASVSWKNNSLNFLRTKLTIIALRSSFSHCEISKACWNQKCLHQTFNILIKSWQIYCKNNESVGLSCFELYNLKFIVQNSKKVEPIEIRVVWSNFWVIFHNSKLKIMME